MQQPPYVPRTGLSSGAPHAQNQQQPSIDQIAQKPIDLFDPNFLQQNQLSKDLNVVESIFGAQNAGSGAAGSQLQPPLGGGADLSKMSERDRRIFLRDQERKNRSQGVGSTSASYGVPEPPPIQSTGANIFGEQQPPVASNQRDLMWQQKMAQRQGSMGGGMPPPAPPPHQFQPSVVPSQGQGGFMPATQINQPLAQMPAMSAMQHPSPNTAHRKFKAIGQSPLRSSNILTSAAAQQSPMRTSLTAQKLQQAKELDTSIQSYESQQHLLQMQMQQQQFNQGHVMSHRGMPGGPGLPPSGASPMIRKDSQGKAGGLLDQLGNNELDMKRRQDTRAQQQNEYNRYLAAQQPNQQQPQAMPMSRQRSASGRQLPDVSSSLHTGGMQMIGGHQMRQQEDKQKMQRDYQHMLNEQMQFKQNQHNDAVQLSEARRKQISDQVFNELMSQEPESVRSYMGGQLHQMVQSSVPNLPQIDQPPVQQMNPGGGGAGAQYSGRSGLPPRVQSAVGANRREEVQRLQRGQVDQEDPIFRNRQNEHSAKRREAEKKREYAALLQEQMAQKKKQKGPDAAQLPLPDQLFDAGGGGPYPPGQTVDFYGAGGPPQQPPLPPHQQQSQPYQQPAPPRPQYSMNQQVSFDPPSMLPDPASYSNQVPLQGRPMDPYSNRQASRSPNRVHPNDQTQPGEAASAHQQRSRQDEYRRQLEDQMRLNEEKKRRAKEEEARYNDVNDKDMAQYMGAGQPAPRGADIPHVTGAFPQSAQMPPAFEQPNMGGMGAGGDFYGGGMPPPSQQMQGGSNNPGGQPSAIRVGTDITKQHQEVDPAKQQAKLKYQEEIKQQMEEAKARKEAAKRKEKQQDEELERRIQGEQQRLAQQEVDEIKKEGKRDAPELKQQAKQVRRDQFQTSAEAAAQGPREYQEPAPSVNMADPPTVAKADQFVTPNPIQSQPLRLHSADNFTLQGPSSAEMDAGARGDVFGQQAPSSLLPDSGLPPPQAPGGGGEFGGPSPFGGPPPPGGLQGPFGAQQSTQYSQFGGGAPPPHPFAPPSSAPLSNQQMSTQSDWMAQQQNQAGKMFEDQQKMIGMYQQALEQILQYRNQYFEQAMQMRENILKEREQLFEYEKLKQQQLSEMDQLKAVQNQLGTMLDVAGKQPVLNPTVTNNLNSYITQQKEQILQMSQSSSNMSKLIRDAQMQQQQMQQQQPQMQQQPPLPQLQTVSTPMSQELPVTSQRVEIPRQSLLEMPQSNPQQIDFSPPPDEDGLDLQKQVDELAAQIAANDIDQQNRQLNAQQMQRLSGQHPLQDAAQQQELMLRDEPPSSYGEFRRNPEFEQSLSSESKMVKVPNENLLAMAAAAQESAAKSNRPDILTETWNEQSAKKNLEREGVISPTRGVQSTTPTPQHLQDGQRLVTPKRLGGNLITNPRSPLHSSVVPQTIPELPHEEEKPQANVDGMRASGFDFTNGVQEKKSEYDLNNRALSGTSSPQRALVSLEAREEMEKIERIVQQQTQSAWADRRATMTGTSFYDNHRQTQKLQEQTQQEEMQKQLMRILGSTSQSAAKEDDPLRAMQQAYGPETDREKNQQDGDHKTQHSSTVKVRSSQDNMLKEPFRLAREEEEARQNQQRPTWDNPADPRSQSDQTGSEINIAATAQSANLRKMQEVAAAENVDQSRSYFQASEVHDQSRMTDQKAPSERQQWNKEQEVQEQEASIWDDPDLVPVPVLPDFGDTSLQYEVHGENTLKGQVARQMPPSAYSSQPYYGAHSISPTDHTIVGLQQMVPDLIATDEFELEQIHDETTGEDQFLLNSKHGQNQGQAYNEEHKKQHFQTYKQSEPVTFDARSRVDASVSQPPTAPEQSVIPTQIGLSQRGEEEEGLKSARSRKEQEMAEIEELIRKVTNTANVTDQKEKELALKRQLQGDGNAQSPRNKNLNTPAAPSTGKHALIGDSPDDAPKMQTAAANVAPHRLGQMQRAASEMQPPKPVVSNDQQILSDLDKIIANLEMQQKNMATFGVPTPLEEDAEGEDRAHRQEQEEQALNPNPPSLVQARARGNATAQDGVAGDRPVSGKAPLDPKSSRPKSGRSIKSRGTSAKGRSGIDASPQRIGKYAMMALQQQTGASGGNNASPSPQRLGKFAQMALQQSPKPVVGEDVDTISQKYGRNPSRERLEERSMLSQANQSRITSAAQHAQAQNAQASGPILRPVSGKSNNSRYTVATKVGAAGRPPSNMNTIQHDQESNQGFRQTTRTAGQMTVGTAALGTNERRASNQKIAYYSDEEEDPMAANATPNADAGQRAYRAQFSESGRTQMTAQNQASRFNIADEQDDVNF